MLWKYDYDYVHCLDSDNERPLRPIEKIKHGTNHMGRTVYHSLPLSAVGIVHGLINMEEHGNQWYGTR